MHEKLAASTVERYSDIRKKQIHDNAYGTGNAKVLP